MRLTSILLVVLLASIGSAVTAFAAEAPADAGGAVSTGGISPQTAPAQSTPDSSTTSVAQFRSWLQSRGLAARPEARAAVCPILCTTCKRTGGTCCAILNDPPAPNGCYCSQDGFC